MPEPDLVDQSLAIARRALTPSASNKQRVRATLTASAAGAAPRAGAIGPMKASLAAVALVGAGFVAGYWLGRHPDLDPFAAPVVAATSAVEPVGNDHAGERRNAEPPGASRTSVTWEPRSADSEPPASIRSQTTPAPEGSPHPTPARDSERPPQRAHGPERPTHDQKPSAATSGDAFLEELGLLARAERAIRANRAQLALTFLDELANEYPNSPLSEERAAARLLAECLLLEPTARGRAERYLREHAASVYIERIRRTCALDRSPPAPGTSASSHPR